MISDAIFIAALGPDGAVVRLDYSALLRIGSANDHDGHVILNPISHHRSSETTARRLSGDGKTPVEDATKSLHTVIKRFPSSLD
jgi:hypothetical protein